MIQNPHLDGGSFYWPGGPTGILLLHGFTASTAEVRPLAVFLHKKGFTVAGPLLPGHLSDPRDLNRVTWHDWAAAAEQGLGQLRQSCRQWIVAGESAGGLLALYLAAQHPEIAGVLTFAPALKTTFSRSDRLKVRLFAPFIPYVRKSVSDSTMPWQGYPVYPLKGALQLFSLQKAVRKLLHQIRQPLLIVHGRLDQSVSQDVPDILMTETSSAYKETIWMEKSGHVILLDVEQETVFFHALDFIHRVLSERIQV